MIERVRFEIWQEGQKIGTGNAKGETAAIERIPQEFATDGFEVRFTERREA